MKNLIIISLIFFAIISEGYTQGLSSMSAQLQKSNEMLGNAISGKSTTSAFTPQPIVLPGSTVNTSTTTVKQDHSKVIDFTNQSPSEFRAWLFDNKLPVNTNPAQGVRNNPNYKLERYSQINNLQNVNSSKKNNN